MKIRCLLLQELIRNDCTKQQVMEDPDLFPCSYGEVTSSKGMVYCTKLGTKCGKYLELHGRQRENPIFYTAIRLMDIRAKIPNI